MAGSRGPVLPGISLRGKNRARERVRRPGAEIIAQALPSLQASQRRQKQAAQPGVGNQIKEMKLSHGGGLKRFRPGWTIASRPGRFESACESWIKFRPVLGSLVPWLC